MKIFESRYITSHVSSHEKLKAKIWTKKQTGKPRLLLNNERTTVCSIVSLTMNGQLSVVLFVSAGIATGIRDRRSSAMLRSFDS